MVHSFQMQMSSEEYPKISTPLSSKCISPFHLRNIVASSPIRNAKPRKITNFHNIEDLSTPHVAEYKPYAQNHSTPSKAIDVPKRRKIDTSSDDSVTSDLDLTTKSSSSPDLDLTIKSSSPSDTSVSPLDLSSGSNQVDTSCVSSPESQVKFPKKRVMFKKCQVNILDSIFEKVHYPEPNMISHLAQEFETTDTKIKVWFQNRRARQRRRGPLIPPASQQVYPHMANYQVSLKPIQAPSAIISSDQLMMQNIAYNPFISFRQTMPGIVPYSSIYTQSCYQQN